MSRLTRIAVALLLSSAAVVACGDEETSFFLRITGADGASQLEVSGHQEDALLFGPERRPDTADATLSGEQTLRIRFNTPPGAPVRIQVSALADGRKIAEGSAEDTPRKGEEVELRIGLLPVTQEPGTDGGADGGVPDAGEPDGGTDGGDPDAGLPDGGAPDAGGPDAGAPDAGVCTGCTQGSSCLPGDTEAACGTAGNTCQACVGDAYCVAGQCQRCTPQSCPLGCCDRGVCYTPSQAQCGLSGAACVACTNNNACADGQCRCGSNNACVGSATCQLNGVCL